MEDTNTNILCGSLFSMWGSLCSTLDTNNSNNSVSVGNGTKTAVSGMGSDRARAFFEEEIVPIEIRNALYIPELMCNLISVSRLRQAGMPIAFDTNRNGKGVCVVTRSGSEITILKAFECAAGLYKVDLRPDFGAVSNPFPVQSKLPILSYSSYCIPALGILARGY